MLCGGENNNVRERERDRERERQRERDTSKTEILNVCIKLVYTKYGIWCTSKFEPFYTRFSRYSEAFASELKISCKYKWLYQLHVNNISKQFE